MTRTRLAQLATELRQLAEQASQRAARLELDLASIDTNPDLPVSGNLSDSLADQAMALAGYGVELRRQANVVAQHLLHPADLEA